MDNLKTPYTDEELAEFKALILKKIQNAEKEKQALKAAYKNGAGSNTNDTEFTFKPMEEGSNTISKESNAKLEARQEKFISDLKRALIRIENKTYGICVATGKAIEKERLRIVPHTTLSIEAKKKQF